MRFYLNSSKFIRIKLHSIVAVSRWYPKTRKNFDKVCSVSSNNSNKTERIELFDCILSPLAAYLILCLVGNV